MTELIALHAKETAIPIQHRLAGLATLLLVDVTHRVAEFGWGGSWSEMVELLLESGTATPDAPLRGICTTIRALSSKPSHVSLGILACLVQWTIQFARAARHAPPSHSTFSVDDLVVRLQESLFVTNVTRTLVEGASAAADRGRG